MIKVAIISSFLFFSFNVFSQKDECSKCFLKNKLKGSTAFEHVVQTKSLTFLHQHKSFLYVRFKRDQDINYMVFSQSYYSNLLNQAYQLGQSIKIAIQFSDSSFTYVTFSGNESVELDVQDKYISTNQTAIDSSLAKKLSSNYIIRVEVLNPFNGRNQDKVITSNMPKSEADKIKKYYNCFITI